MFARPVLFICCNNNKMHVFRALIAALYIFNCRVYNIKNTKINLSGLNYDK